MEYMLKFLPYFIALPLLASFLITVVRDRLNGLDRLFAVAAVISTLVLSIFALSSLGRVTVYHSGGWPAPFGISFVLDSLSILMLVVVNTIALAVTLYSISYIQRYTDPWKYFTLLMLMVAGMNGVILAGDILNLYIFLEIAAIASYSLVAFGGEGAELEASFRYLILGSIASMMILIAIGLSYGFASSLNMADISVTLSRVYGGWLIRLVSILFLVGFSIKGALFPFHAWLPDAHQAAPAPISAMLSGVLIKTLGVYAVARVFFNVIGFSQALSGVFLILGSISMLFGILLSFYQWDFKRLLAYSSISQIGYIVVGLGLGTPLGIFGALFHLCNHAVFKSLLFLNAGAVEHSTGTRDLRELGGLRTKMPATSVTAFIASMSISGVPPFNGFWSKLVIITACIQAGKNVVAFVAVLSSILALAVFLKLYKYVFSGELKEKHKEVKEAPVLMVSAMIFLAILCVAASALYFDPLRGTFFGNADRVLLMGLNYGKSVININ
jgi:multicomponent Na+:H+ antiporter subunit D